ncbi:MAG: DUF4258 domain-containing protein [Casimicrobiaceae bacterium]
MAPDLAAMLTRHARSRMQQRGIPPAQIEEVLSYGRERHDRHGGVIVYLDHRAKRRMAREGKASAGEVNRLAGLYVVIAGGRVATVGHRYRRFRH